ncbi:MAG: hypothetical protein ABIJ34_05145 [archaeon]
MHYLIEKSFRELYPEKEIPVCTIKYSRAFKDFNANVRYTKTSLLFRLSYLWKNVSDEIKIGLLQHLLNKVYKTHNRTMNVEFYEIFLKKLPNVTPKTQSDPILESSFDRINMEYFQGQIMQPNLMWGDKTFRTLGSYNHLNDTVKISTVLKNDQHLLDYVMYHELLHKKLKYYETEKKRIHHSPEFKRLEKEFKDEDVEDKLKAFLRKEKFKRFFWF